MSVDTDLATQLPPELWLKVFRRVMQKGYWAEIEQIRHITLACRLFRSLAQPMLFRRLALRLWDFSKRLPFNYGIVDAQLQRLMLFASDKIASHVRYIDVTTRDTGPLTLVDLYPEDARNTLFHTLFNLLPRFNCLRMLSIQCTRINGHSPPPLAWASLPLGYEAPHPLLSLVCGSSLWCINMRRFRALNYGVHEPSQLQAFIMPSHDLFPRVETLDIGIVSLTEDALRTIFLFFSRSKDMHIRVQNNFLEDDSSLQVRMRSVWR